MNFLTLTHFLYFSIVEADKIAKNKVGPMIWDTLYKVLFKRIKVKSIDVLHKNIQNSIIVYKITFAAEG